jgi:hypothetical protein
VKEEVGDYLGSKIPSLLEFMENKINLRTKLGISRIDTINKGPSTFPHFKPTGLIQEEKFINIMKHKDSFHQNIVF